MEGSVGRRPDFTMRRHMALVPTGAGPRAWYPNQPTLSLSPNRIAYDGTGQGFRGCLVLVPYADPLPALPLFVGMGE